MQASGGLSCVLVPEGKTATSLCCRQAIKLPGGEMLPPVKWAQGRGEGCGDVMICSGEVLWGRGGDRRGAPNTQASWEQGSRWSRRQKNGMRSAAQVQSRTPEGSLLLDHLAKRFQGACARGLCRAPGGGAARGKQPAACACPTRVPSAPRAGRGRVYTRAGPGPARSASASAPAPASLPTLPPARPAWRGSLSASCC